MSIRVSVILERKGAAVATIGGEATLLTAAKAMVERNIGALVVSGDGEAVDGIVSERDLVRHFARWGSDGWERPVSEVMTSPVTTCGPQTTVGQLMATMTEQRIRHVPVLVGGRLAGIVSIGDVVKTRLDDLEVQASTLEQYVTGSHG